MFEKEITFDRFIRGLIGVAGLVLAIYILNRLSMVLLPFFLAWLFAYMIYPMVTFFQYKLRLRNRILCIIITLLLILAAITGFFALIIPPAITEFMRFRTVITDLFQDSGNSTIAKSIEDFLKQHIDQNTIIQLLQKNNIVEALKVAVNQMWTLLSQTVNLIIAILGLCMTLLSLFFLLIPKRSRRFVAALMQDVQHGMNSYFRGQALVAFLVGILFSIGFLIIDFPLAICLGMFVGFLNLVPYMQAIGFIPTILLAFIKANETGGNIWLILLSACIVFIVVQAIQDSFLVPKIMGKLMGLNPAVILLSLSVWGSLLGLIGLIIALPLTTLLLSYYRRFIERDERRVQLSEKRRHKHRVASAPTYTSSSTAQTMNGPTAPETDENK